MMSANKTITITLTVGTLILLIGSFLAWATTGSGALIYAKIADKKATDAKTVATELKVEHEGYRRDLDNLNEDQREHRTEQRAMFKEIRGDLKYLRDRVNP